MDLAAEAADFPIKVVRSATRAPRQTRERLLEAPGFGQVFTDHMITATWLAGKGWHDAQVSERRPFQLDPAAAVLHYAQEVFEGLKAYRSGDKTISLFRPEQNARRINISAARLSMPMVPEALFLSAIESLVRIDADWIPGDDGSLYLRPFMFASEPFLGVRAAREYVFCVIASPVGSYFKDSSGALTLWVSQDLNRAGPGGTGAAKCGGNYASSLAAQTEAAGEGCDQVVFLDAVEHRFIDELGGMNIFFLFDDGSVVTPPLTGTILPGITRASIIELLARRGVEVREEPYAIDQWQADSTSGYLREAFACGTAAVVTSIGRVKASFGEWQIGKGEPGRLAAELCDELTAIQRCKISGPEGWVRQVRL